MEFCERTDAPGNELYILYHDLQLIVPQAPLPDLLAMPFFTPGGLPAFFYQQLFVTPTLDPSLSFTGQTIIITGANAGLGFSAAQQIAQRGASKLILAVRTLSKGEAAASEIRAKLSSISTGKPTDIEVWPLDLSSYQSVQDFAVRAQGLERLDVLLENAGVSFDDFHLMGDDEATITTNVVSTSLLAVLLLPKLRETATKFGVVPHLTMVSSETAFWAKFEERKAENMFEKLADPKSNMADRYVRWQNSPMHYVNHGIQVHDIETCRHLLLPRARCSLSPVITSTRHHQLCQPWFLQHYTGARHETVDRLHHLKIPVAAKA